MSKPTIDAHEVAARWKSKGFDFGVFTDPPGQVWKDFVHETDELLMAIKGDMELEIEGRKVQCEVGKEILIPAGVVHTVRNVGRTGSQWFYGYKESPRV